MGCPRIIQEPFLEVVKSPKGSFFSMEKMDTGAYLYAFNGMEKDNEVYGGSGNSYTTEFRSYSPRLGRWLSLDPKQNKFASFSPFNFCLNNPILNVDEKGDEIIFSGRRKDVRRMKRDLEAATGLSLKVNFFTGQVTYKTDASGVPIVNANANSKNNLPISNIGQERLKTMIDDQCVSVNVGFNRGKGNTGNPVGAWGEDGRYYSKANIDYNQIDELQYKVRSGTGKGSDLVTARYSISAAMVFFHETDHSWNASWDEIQMNAPVDNGFGDERSAGGIQEGSASAFTNEIRKELSIPLRATYYILNNGVKYVPFVDPQLSPDQVSKVLDSYKDKHGSKSPGLPGKGTSFHLEVEDDLNNQDNSRDYGKNPE